VTFHCLCGGSCGSRNRRSCSPGSMCSQIRAVAIQRERSPGQKEARPEQLEIRYRELINLGSPVPCHPGRSRNGKSFEGVSGITGGRRGRARGELHFWRDELCAEEDFCRPAPDQGRKRISSDFWVRPEFWTYRRGTVDVFEAIHAI
jgi:hypothetical protein